MWLILSIVYQICRKIGLFAVLNTKGRAVAGLAGRAYTASQTYYCSNWMSRVRAWDGWKENGIKMAKRGVYKETGRRGSG